MAMGQLRSLDASWNEIGSLEGLQVLTGVKEVVLDHNAITHLGISRPLTRTLTHLRLTHNHLTRFDGRVFPGLRRLMLDHNAVCAFNGAKGMPMLRSLGIAWQRADMGDDNGRRGPDEGVLEIAVADMPHLVDVRLSHTRVSPATVKALLCGCEELERVEARRCGLEGMLRGVGEKSDGRRVEKSLGGRNQPPHPHRSTHTLAQSAFPQQQQSNDARPRIAHLDLRDNALTDSDLAYLGVVVDKGSSGGVGSEALRVLLLSGNAVRDFRAVARLLRRARGVEVLDLRYNPITARFYPPPATTTATAGATSPTTATPCASSSSAVAGRSKAGLASGRDHSQSRIDNFLTPSRPLPPNSTTATPIPKTPNASSTEVGKAVPARDPTISAASPWRTRDEHFTRKQLSDADYIRRLCYRSHVVHVLRRSLRWLDGAVVDERERWGAKEKVRRVRDAVRG
ncbi:uncharacterized protein EV422DRAFT_548766 [Fimicolochytrium jonesii]|uniref:uncharacterized protein n=1 Tax=Fimicolochytrium jonesii TaxID=1396493 RepID=UPI0022FE3D6C|nr:uncharacterized protein EV422DRAFT_548766 [Fimicolochytrium jonesii]KAI8815619.1 hypothetical protein EV422DRAFT_548766 [Fimicolochytrium jonesii]